MNTSDQIDWEDLKVFKAVAACLTVRAAARLLNVHHSTVSRRIEKLEAMVGAQLFERRPDGFLMTSAGEELVTATQVFSDELFNVHRRISGRDNRLVGQLSVTMAEPLAELVFVPKLKEFIRQYPDLELQILATTDFLDVARRQADIAIRMDNNPPETLIGKRLYKYADNVYASPEYMRRIEQLSRHEYSQHLRWLRWAESDGERPSWSADTEFAAVPAWGLFPNIRVQQAAARQGLGLSMLPCLIGDSDPLLVRAAVKPPIPARDIWILTHSDLSRMARIRAFTSFAEHVLREAKPRITGCDTD
ncbi:MAG: LysR family transcriptional regulator, partial [Pseudomonadota bacterium]